MALNQFFDVLGFYVGIENGRFAPSFYLDEWFGVAKTDTGGLDYFDFIGKSVFGEFFSELLDNFLFHYLLVLLLFQIPYQLHI